MLYSTVDHSNSDLSEDGDGEVEESDGDAVDGYEDEEDVDESRKFLI